MFETTKIQILNRIKKAAMSVLFFTESFLAYGNADAVRQALARLVKSGELDRVPTGIYVRPQTDSIVVKVTTGIEDIAKAIAKRDRADICLNLKSYGITSIAMASTGKYWKICM